VLRLGFAGRQAISRTVQPVFGKVRHPTPGRNASKSIKIGGSTRHDFASKNLTACGGLLPVAAMLEKLQFQQLASEIYS